MKLSITCFDPIVISILRVNGWAGAVDSEDLPLLESTLKAKNIPAIVVMEGGPCPNPCEMGEGPR